jgi:hypothetical protein
MKEGYGPTNKNICKNVLGSMRCMVKCTPITVYYLLLDCLYHSIPTCGGFGLEIGCALVTGTLWGVVTTPLSPPGKENDDVDETAGDVTPGRTLVLQGYVRGCTVTTAVQIDGTHSIRTMYMYLN